MAIKIHICAAKADYDKAVLTWGKDKLVKISDQPSDDAQIFETWDPTKPKTGCDYTGLSRWVAIFDV